MSNELPLNPFWKSLGAEFETEKGWRVPSFFKPAEQEYKLVTEKAGFQDISHFGKIEVRGADRTAFLNNILSNDIENLKPGQGCMAALLTAPAKVIAMMDVYAFEDHLLLIVEPDVTEKLLAALDKFIITEDVTLINATGKYAHFFMCGPNAAPLAPLSLPSPLKRKAFHLLCPAAEGQALATKLIQLRIPLIGLQTAEQLRIENGEPRYGYDVDETISLPETGLDDAAASETKGCYPGQEVVARTKTYKGLQRKLVRISLEGRENLKRGEKLYDKESEKEMGVVTSAAGKFGMALVTKDFFTKL